MPDDVWDEYPRICGTFDERTGFPCQMPESLLTVLSIKHRQKKKRQSDKRTQNRFEAYKTQTGGGLKTKF